MNFATTKAGVLPLRDRILGRFSPDISKLLIEFNKYLASLDADYIIFMARKAMRLYDLLVLAGGAQCERPVLSNHVLDENLEIFARKKIALVDDTLILGTTLGKAKRRLADAGAREITTHVFCVDSENWCRELLIPERVFCHLSHEKMLTFCAAEVSALAAVGIPYLTDLPVSEGRKLSSVEFALLQNLEHWDVYTLTSPSQERDGVTVFTFLPRPELLETFQEKLGDTFGALIDICKVRVFIRKAGSAYWARVVPIVTLRPLADPAIGTLFGALLSFLQVAGSVENERLNRFLTTSIGKLRFIQYSLSIIFGELFLAELNKTFLNQQQTEFDLGEAVRHYGPWLKTELESVHQSAREIAATTFRSKQHTGGLITEAPLPDHSVQTIETELSSFIKPDPSSARAEPTRSLLTDLMQVFLDFYRTHEKPARDEVRRYGANIYEVDPHLAPHRDRLEFGFAWRVLARQLMGGASELTQRRLNVLSLALDHLIDMGIAVPILCSRDGVLFRAYRHGEDVLFGDQEIALSYDVAHGYLDATQKTSIPRLQLEKLIVTLIRVGAAKEMLTVVHGISGHDGIARIGFHLHGAVAFMPQQETFVADERDSWLSQYMLDRDALRASKNNEYELGTRPEAALKRVGADSEARQLGWLVGTLFGATENGQRVFNQEDLILLSTCISPRDTAAALAVEMRLVERWFSRDFSHRLRQLRWNDAAALSDLLGRLTNGYGYTALHSAKLKFVSYKQGRPRTIIDNCERFLQSLPGGHFFALEWRGNWDSVLAENSEEQISRFDPWINNIAGELLAVSLGIFSIQIALHEAIGRLNSNEGAKKRGEQIRASFESFLNDMESYVDLRDEENRFASSLQEAPQHPHRSAEYALRWIDQRLPAFSATTRQVLDVVKDFGRLEHRINFSNVLWYDIVDSTGQKSGLTGGDLKLYRDRVRDFKKEIGKEIFGLTKDASRQNGLIHSWQGGVFAKDDEKHIFFAGTRNLSWVRETLKILLRRAQVHGVLVRIIALPADFAGIPAYRFKNEATVDGEQFWEHLSRVKSQLRKMEEQPKTTYLWVGGKLGRTLELDGVCEWDSHRKAKITTEIEDFELTTAFAGGRLKL